MNAASRARRGDKIPKALLRKKAAVVIDEEQHKPRRIFEPTDEGDFDDSPLPEGLEYCRIWFLYGPDDRSFNRDSDQPFYRFAIKDPPVCGYHSAFVIRKDKRSIVFDPATFQSWNVPSSCHEIMNATPEPFRCGSVLRRMNAKWASLQSNGLQADYDMAAMILRMLEAPVPDKVELKEEIAARRPPKKEGPSGGKEAADKLLKPVVKNGKRGKMLEFFLRDGPGQPRSLREAMAEFETTRSNVLSTLYNLNKDHGIGYVLQNDAATLEVPKGKLWTEK